MSKSYVGVRDPSGDPVVMVKIGRRQSELRLTPVGRSHRAEGFDWGAERSDRAALAHAILTDALGELVADEGYERFRHEVVETFSRDGFQISLEAVVDWASAGAVKL